MTESIIAEKTQTANETGGSARRAVGIIGVPLAYGASMVGVELGPAALRVARLKRRIADLGYSVRDLGDIPIEPEEPSTKTDEKLRHLSEIRSACVPLAQKVEEILAAGEMPLVLGETILSPSAHFLVSLPSVAAAKKNQD